MPWQMLKNAVSTAVSGGVRAVFDQVKGAFSGGSPQSRAGFTMAVVALAAKMSKADGVASDIEAEMFDRQFNVPDHERENVRRLFELAAQDVAGFETYAAQIARMLQDDPDLKISILECLFHIATADGVLHPAEDDFVRRVSDAFGLAEAQFKCLRRSFVSDPDSPYEILDVSPRASDAEIKAQYRALVKSHHPDALVAKGVPPEFLQAAERRLAAITSAYEAILSERGQRSARELEPAP